MKLNSVHIIALMAVVIAVLSVSGCLSACLPTSFMTGNNANAAVSISDNTITITGDKADAGHDQLSGKFALENGAYLMSWENSNRSAEAFNAYLEANKGLVIVSSGKPKGSSVIVIGEFLARPGLYHLNVINGEKYTVTIAKPTTGATLPLSIDYTADDGVVKVVQLEQGILKIDLRYATADKNGTLVRLYDTSGKLAYSEYFSMKNSLNAGNTTAIPARGLYLFTIGNVPAGGCSVNLSQL